MCDYEQRPDFPATLSPGWLARAFQRVERNVAQWPVSLRKQAGLWRGSDCDEGEVMASTVAIPEWIFEHPERGDFYLLSIHDGVGSVDGGHWSPEGVAKAKRLIESIACIRPKPGTRHVMVRIEPVPEFGGAVNEDAIAAINAAPRGQRSRRVRSPLA